MKSRRNHAIIRKMTAWFPARPDSGPQKQDGGGQDEVDDQRLRPERDVVPEEGEPDTESDDEEAVDDVYVGQLLYAVAGKENGVGG